MSSALQQSLRGAATVRQSSKRALCEISVIGYAHKARAQFHKEAKNLLGGAHRRKLRAPTSYLSMLFATQGGDHETSNPVTKSATASIVRSAARLHLCHAL